MIFGAFNTTLKSTPPITNGHEITLPFGKIWINNHQKFSTPKYEIYVLGHITNLKSLTKKANLSGPAELFQHLMSKHNEQYYRPLEGTFLIIDVNNSRSEVRFINNNHLASNLFYAEDQNKTWIATRVEQLLPEINSVQPYLPSIRSFVANGFTVSEQIQIKGIRKLLPSYRLDVSKNGHSLTNHWPEEVRFNRQPFENLEQKLDEYEETYQDVVSRFIEAKKPDKLGLLLSGGHDTSFALIQTKKVYEKSIKAMTISFPDWAFDEEAYAKNIADKVGADFQAIPFTSTDLDSTEKMLRAVEEPAVGVALPLFALSQKAKSYGVDTIIGGDGGDTLWGEYYPVGEIHRYIKNWPKGLRSFAHNLTHELAKLTDWERLWELEHVMDLFSHDNFYDQFMTKLCTYRHFRSGRQQQLFTPEFYGDGSVSRSHYEVPFSKENFNDALIEGKLFNAFYTYMGFSQTKLMQYNQQDFFMPTVQRPVRDFINSLPMNWINGGTTLHRLTNSKSINRKFHKKALARYLKREEIYNRSFDIPWNRILMPRENALKLLQESLKKRGWYNPAYIDQLFSEFRGQRVKDYELLQLNNHGYRIFTLLSLETWAKLYLDGYWKQSPADSLEEFLQG